MSSATEPLNLDAGSGCAGARPVGRRPSTVKGGQARVGLDEPEAGLESRAGFGIAAVLEQTQPDLRHQQRQRGKQETGRIGTGGRKGAARVDRNDRLRKDEEHRAGDRVNSKQGPWPINSTTDRVFTIVMGCNGAGKSAWKRDNYDRLPNQYFDQDSVAGGIGDWNSEEARVRTRRIVDAEIAKAIENRQDFGIESTYSGTHGREMVKRAKNAGYRIEGVYIGTQSPDMNAERIHHRVSVNTGHWIDVDRLPQRYGFSLSNLRKTAERFDTLEIVDNSDHNAKRIPEPIDQLVLENGVVTSRANELKPWCATWLRRFEKSLANRQDE